MLECQWQRTEQGCDRCHHNRPEAQRRGLDDCSPWRHFLPAFGLQRESIIMIAFFLTIPINNTMPIKATIDRSWPQSISARSAPTPAEGRVDRIVNG